jgi:hypothetical protein
LKLFVHWLFRLRLLQDVSTLPIGRLEKRWLSGRILGIAKIGQPNTNQAKALLWAQVYAFHEAAGRSWSIPHKKKEGRWAYGYE